MTSTLGRVDEFMIEDREVIPLRNQARFIGIRLSRRPEAMSTRMDEDDWTHTLMVFRACLPCRGRKAEDDRRFLEALHFFVV